MEITNQTTVAEIATREPATIAVFQRHGIDFCCGGKIPLAEACAVHGVDANQLRAELDAATAGAPGGDVAPQTTLTELIAHIQARFHVPLRHELPRLAELMARVVERHGKRLPETLLPLQATYLRLQHELLEHMEKEDRILFPAVTELETARHSSAGPAGAWIEHPIRVMESEHEAAGVALATMRELTGGYVPPEDACPTFRGLYHGLEQLERDMHVHVHLENNILFPRAERLAGG